MRTSRLFIGAVTLLLASCGQSEEWQGWVYPNRDNLDDPVRIGPFATFEACQQTAINVSREMYEVESAPASRDSDHQPITPDYECGFRCEAPDKSGMTVCKETRK